MDTVDEQKKNEIPFYEIIIKGQFDTSWSHLFESLDISFDGKNTTLRGPVKDQAALQGILNRVFALNLTLLALNRIHPDSIENYDHINLQPNNKQRGTR